MNLPDLKYDTHDSSRDHPRCPGIIQSDDGIYEQTSLQKTIETGYTHFWSRSRQKFWKKGESSGHLQEVQQILYDCDKDTVLIRVVQKGPGACHTGHRSCFYTDISGSEISGKVFSEEDVYGKK